MRSTARRCPITSKRRWSTSTTARTKASGTAPYRLLQYNFIPKRHPARSMRAACSVVGWIRSAEAEGIQLAFGSSSRRVALIVVTLLALAPVAAVSQDLPRLHITALGLHADQRVVRPGQAFHVTVHVHVREKRDRLDELVLPALTNAVDLGDERKRVPEVDGTDFYETL